MPPARPAGTVRASCRESMFAVSADSRYSFGKQPGASDSDVIDAKSARAVLPGAVHSAMPDVDAHRRFSRSCVGTGPAASR